MATYIKKKIGIVEYNFILDPKLYKVGYNYEDYLNDKWIILTDENLAFLKKYPNCSIEEMLSLELKLYQTDEEKLLKKVKNKKIKQTDQYDISINVNSFYLNGKLVWLDKSTRVGLMNSLEIEKVSGYTETTLWFDDICYKISIDTVILMLQSLEIYAKKCYNKTSEHKVAIQNLNTIDEVKNYDFTTGYPDKLIFNT